MIRGLLPPGRWQHHLTVTGTAVMKTINTYLRRLNRPAHYLILLLIPVAASAGYGCGPVDSAHGGNVTFAIPSPIVFQQSSLPSPGQVLYSHNFPLQYYVCSSAEANIVTGFQASLAATISGSYFHDLQKTLAKAGLALRFIVTRSDGTTGTWVPDTSHNQFFEVSNVYGKNSGSLSTGKQTFRMKMELYVKEQVTRALKISLPASSAGVIRLVWKRGGDSESYPNIKYSASGADLWYLPTCIGKVTIPSQIKFERVYTGADKYAGTLPQGKSFTIKAQYNSSCGYPDTTTGYNDLNLKLRIKFTSEGPGETRDKYIILKNDADKNNGLRLRIRNINTSKDAVFGNYADIIGLNSTSGVSVNTFSAELDKDPAASGIMTGSFTQRVKVDIDYY